MTLDGFTPDFAPAYLDMCARLGCNPVHLAGVAANESGLRPDAHNPNGHASGLWQLMPDTAKGLGWSPFDCASGLPAFRALTATEQLPWFEKYFSPYKGKLVSRAACYVATFLPADLALSADMNAVLVDKNGRRGWAYSANAGFDQNHDLAITVQELDDAIHRAARGPKWEEFLSLCGLRDEVKPQAIPYDATTPLGQEEFLTKLGFYHGDLDGIPGPLLRAATSAFQQAHGLEPVGYFGPKTRALVQTTVEGWT